MLPCSSFLIAGAALLFLVFFWVFASIGVVSSGTFLLLEARTLNVRFELYRLAFAMVQTLESFETAHALQLLSARQYSTMGGGAMVSLQCKMIFVCRDTPRGRGVSDAGI